MGIKKLLGSDAFFMLNKTLVKELGIDEALILATLIDATEIFEEEWFYQTTETIEGLTTLKRKRQDIAIKNLLDAGLIDKKVMGLPAKRYFKINTDLLLNIVLGTKNTNQIVPKEQTTLLPECNNKNIIDKNITIKKLTLEDEVQTLNVGQDLKKKLIEYLQYRKEIKKTLKTLSSIKGQIKLIGKDYQDEQHLIESIDKSMANEYQGIFPTKNYRPRQQGVEDRMKYMEKLIGG